MPPASDAPRDSTQPLRPRRPLPLKLVFWTLILWAVLGWLRFVRAWADQELITTALSPRSFWAIAGSGLVWGLAGLPALWGLTFRSSWTRPVILIDAALYPVLYWAERLFLWQDQSAQRNWPFMLTLTLAWAAVVFWALQSKRSRDYFNKKNKD